MPFIEINGIKLYYEDSGRGPETIVFCHGLVCNCRMFDAQVEALKDQYRCVTVDFRGHGRSGTGRNGSDMDALSDDVAKLIQKRAVPLPSRVSSAAKALLTNYIKLACQR
jgi:pimeloyl-ACP methyl ester carboxylesterase